PPPPTPTLFPYTTLFRSPGVLQTDEERLRAAPLAPRALDVAPVALGAARDFAGIAHPPAVALEEAPVFDVAVGEQQRELERLARSEEHTSELQSRFDLVC